MTRVRTSLVALILVQFMWGSHAHATPACSITSTISDPNSGSGTGAAGSTIGASNCQWRFTNTGTAQGGGDSGNFYGSMTAPPPGSSAACTVSTQCSNGVRQDKGVTNVLYDNYATACRFVSNTGNTDLFVPQNTLAEFAAFVNGNSSLTFAYCTPAAPSYGYTATATYEANYEIFGNGVAAKLTNLPGAVAATKAVTWALPVTSVPNPSQQETVVLTYGRQDCRVDAGGGTVCDARTITETQVLEVIDVPNISPNCQNQHYAVNSTDCDGSWGGVTKISDTFMVDGMNGPYADGLEDYVAPGTESCDASNGTVYANGGTWSQTSAGTPVPEACPTGQTGTLSCATTVVTPYSCSDGDVVAGVAGAPTTTTNCTGTCVACTVTLYGTDCAGGTPTINEAHAYVYKLAPIPDKNAYKAPAGAYANKGETGSVDLMTSATVVSDVNLYTSEINVPMQNWLNGFPSVPSLTEWYGVCYDGGFNAPAAGSYTFVVAVDDEAAMWIDGTLIFNDSDGVMTTNSKGQPIVTNDLASASGPGGTVYNPNPITAATVTLTAGLHDVMIEYMNGWPVSTEVQFWVYEPGQKSYDNKGDTPPNANLMQLVAPPGAVTNCPH